MSAQSLSRSRINAYVRAVHSGALLDAILDATINRNVGITDRAGLMTGTTTMDAVEDVPGPANKVTCVLRTWSALHLPQVRDLVDIPAGIDGRAEDPDTTAVELRVEVPITLTGYARDADATAITKESENAKSQVRIGRSSSVKAPGAPAA